MQNIEDTINRIFKITDRHWDAQSWKDLTGFEYAETVRLRAQIGEVSNLLKQKDGRALGITGKEKMILENYVLWYKGLTEA